MEEKIKETYTKDGKNLLDLIQEWINGNMSVLYSNSEKKDININVDK